MNWPVVPLGNIAEVKLGKMLDKAKHRSGRPLPYLRNINVRWGSVDTTGLLEMNFEDDELDRFGLKEGDVLVCEGGEPGRAAVWDNSVANIKYQKAIHRVRFKQPYEPRLLVYLLEQLAQTGRLERRFTGSTIKHFTREAIIQLPVPVPPLDEQQRIVAEIEKQFTRLDAGLASLKRVQRALRGYRASVLKAACEGRLVPREGAPWKRATLVELLIPGRSIGYGVLKPGPHISGGVRLLKSGQVRDDMLDLADDFRISPALDHEFRRTRIMGGEILLNLVGASIGRSAIAPPELRGSNVSRAIAVIPVEPQQAKWVQLNLRSPEGQRGMMAGRVGIAQPVLNLARVKQLEISLPSSAEQRRILEEVDRRESVIRGLEEVLKANLLRAKAFRRSVLADAFSASS